MKEIWKDIKGYEGYYQISNLGRVKSLERKIKCKAGKYSTHREKILKNTLSNNGYYSVGLWVESKGIRKNIHRLLAMAFIDNPLNKRQVNHINGIKTDNRIENLEWVTPSENTKHAYDIGLQIGKGARGEKSHKSKLTEEEVKEIRFMFSSGMYTHKSIGSQFGVTSQNIGSIVRNDTWIYI